MLVLEFANIFCVCVWGGGQGGGVGGWVQGQPRRIHKMFRAELIRIPPLAGPFAGNLVNTSLRKLTALLLPGLLLLLVVARLSSLITGKLFPVRFPQEDVLGYS